LSFKQLVQPGCQKTFNAGMSAMMATLFIVYTDMVHRRDASVKMAYTVIGRR
jgi:hypothetical protein